MNENKKILVRVDSVSKKFCKDLKTSLWYGVKDLLSNVTGNRMKGELRPKEFWAVKEISFELRRGECLGLIGHNGAGKSTLLKMLNGLINPDEGKIIIKGRVGALIELGAGFNPILTGRENIYNNGAVLGFTRDEIDSKLEEIIAFSELEEFIDMPVQHYSSGMKVRLGFAIAAQMEPDVLLIDEVLAVGDLGFVLKCFGIIDKLLPKTAVIFVSHSMPMVSKICNSILLLERGQATFFGRDVAKGIDLYYSRFINRNASLMYSDGSIELKKVKLVGFNDNDTGIPTLNRLDDFRVYFMFEVLKDTLDLPSFVLVIFDKEQRPVAYFEPNNNQSEIEMNGNIIEFELVHKKIELSKGIYSIDLVVNKRGLEMNKLRVNNILSFQVIHELDIFPSFLLSSEFKNVRH